MNRGSLKVEEKNLIRNILDKCNTDDGLEKSISNLKKNTAVNLFKKYVCFSESYNGKAMVIDNPNGKISYSYQRHNLELVSSDWIKLLYNYGDRLGGQNFGTFFSCGMGSMSTFIMVMAKKGFRDFVFTDLPYFESYDFATKCMDDLNCIEHKNYNGSNIDVLYLDSGSPKFMSLDYKKVNPKIIACDTSCLDCSDKYIADLISYCDGKGIPLFLLRSHIKLDCFGLEVGRLGSMVYIADTDEYIRETLKFKVPLGNNATLHNIFPWLGDRKFFELSTRRIQKTREVNNIIKRELDKKIDHNKYDVVDFDHELFFTIRFKNRYAGSMDQLNMRLSKYCRDVGLPVNTTSSFYLERVGIDNFERALDNNRQFIRIASCAIPKTTAKRIADRVNEFLVNFV